VGEDHHIAQRQKWQLYGGGWQIGMSGHGVAFLLPVEYGEHHRNFNPEMNKHCPL
jgi:hypothetical protein